MEFFDSHAHYNDEQFIDENDTLLKKIYDEGITKITTVGYNIKSSEIAIKIANKYDFIYATSGISPNDIDDYEETNLEKIYNLAKSKKVVAIGEIGLDYHWNTENKELQKKVFMEQINIANELNLPIVIHTRDAFLDTLDILKNKIKVKEKGIFHCCPFNMELIKEGLKLGFYISFAGPVTYKNSKNAPDAVKEVPIDRLLIETDCPYLSPEPLRGTRNDSRNVKLTAKKIAEFKNIDLEKIAEATYENAKRIFKIL